MKKYLLYFSLLSSLSSLSLYVSTQNWLMHFLFTCAVKTWIFPKVDQNILHPSLSHYPNPICQTQDKIIKSLESKEENVSTIRSSPNKKWDFFNLHIGSRISFGVFDVNDVGLLDVILDPVVWFRCFSCDCVWVLLYMVVSWLDMVKLTGRVGFGLGQTSHGSNESF